VNFVDQIETRTRVERRGLRGESNVFLMSNDQPRRQPFLSNQFISEISGQIHLITKFASPRFDETTDISSSLVS
jgi:hypothetical protein